jgi:hypothetical protein
MHCAYIQKIIKAQNQMCPWHDTMHNSISTFELNYMKTFIAQQLTVVNS